MRRVPTESQTSCDTIHGQGPLLPLTANQTYYMVDFIQSKLLYILEKSEYDRAVLRII